MVSFPLVAWHMVVTSKNQANRVYIVSSRPGLHSKSLGWRREEREEEEGEEGRAGEERLG